MPHGHCYFWRPDLLTLHAASDGLIALAYTSIPFALVYFARRRRDVPFNGVFLLFATFIVACGATHYLEIWTLWHAQYWLSGCVKAITALVSVPTAILLIKLLPTAIALPTAAQLAAATKETEIVRGRFAAIVESSDDAIASFDLQGRVLTWNRGAERLYGYSAEEMVGHEISEFLPEGRRDETQVLLAGVRGGESIEKMETVRRRKDGTLVDVSLTASPIQADGRVIAMATIGRDISAEKQADRQLRHSLREKEALLKEVHHRVKNNLQVISSLLSMQSRKLPDGPTRNALQESQGRVKAIALFHEKVYRSPQLGAVSVRDYAKDIIDGVLREFNATGRIAGRVEGDDVRLGVDLAVPCGLLLNELISNALKHAFPDDRPGSLSVDVRHDAGRVRLTIEDDGVGMPIDLEARKNKSMGLQLVESLVMQLGGQVGFAATGLPTTRVVVEFAAGEA
jgi:PAS domain S-box-containing protein